MTDSHHRHPAAGSDLRTGDGRRIVLGRLIKAGGAGAVFRVDGDREVVAKIYHPGADVAEYAHRIAAMLRARPLLPDIDEHGVRHVQIAWPLAALHDPRGTFVGFLMPAVDVDATSELEVILQERQARAHGLPTGLGAKVTLAANLAAVIAALHSEGHHVVDMKPVNLRFYPRSLYMAMLDCDGFGIRGEAGHFAAPQITPDYLAPEFHRGGLTAAGEEAQDRFALATIVFQLLNFGLHPYSGRPLNDAIATDIPGRIAQHAYPYGLRAHSAIAPGAVSGHMALPEPLRHLFDRAFERGVARPSAAEWAGRLRAYAERARGALVVCARDAAHQHFAGQPCGACVRTALIAQIGRRAGEAQRTARERVDAELAKRTSASPRPFAPQRGQPPRPATGPGARTTGPARPASPRRPAPPRSPRPQPVHPLPASWGQPRRASSPAFEPFKNIAYAMLALLIMVLLRWAWLSLSGTDAQVTTSGPSPPYIVVPASDGQPARLASGSRRPPRRSQPAPAADPRLSVERASEPGRIVAPYVPSDMRRHIVEAMQEAQRGPAAFADSLLLLRERARGRTDAGRASADDLAIAVQAAALSPDALAVRQQEAATRARAWARDPHFAFEAGWLALRERRSNEAESWFLQAVLLAPDKPGPWLGLALVPGDEARRGGALAMFERVAPPADVAGLRAAAAAELAHLRIDPDAWAILSARARVLEAQRTGTDVPAALHRLAESPLPP